MIKPFVFSSPLDGEYIQRLLDNADLGAVALFALADRAGVGVSDVVAVGTEYDLFFDGENSLGKGAGVLFGHTYQEIGETLGTLGANSRELVQLLDEVRHRLDRLRDIVQSGSPPT
jgi:hypothetical protein